MKTIKVFLWLFITLAVTSHSLLAQQRLAVFAIDDPGVYGQITYTVSSLEENYFDLVIRVNWTNPEFTPIADRTSVIGFDVNKLDISTDYLDLITEKPDDGIFAFNSSLTLRFEVAEEFPGGDIKFDFPFFYAPYANAARSEQWRADFSFARPHKFVAVNTVRVSDIIDKTPPKITVLEPDGIEDNVIPIVKSDRARIELSVKDFFGVKNVVVNNLAAQQLDDTTYVVDIVLRYGVNNQVRVVAEDVSGLRSERTFFIESRQPSMVAERARPEPTRGVVPDTVEIEEDDDLSELLIDLPNLGKVYPNRFALIIGNEDYSSYQSGLRTESDVDFAIRDARAFKVFAANILGVPEEHILLLLNAREREMRRALNQINALSRASGGEAEIYVYYAGHGFPDEQTREPYIIPVDVSGAELNYAIKLTDFYGYLTEHPAKRVTVFIDACFSGGGREQGLMAARAVRVRPRESAMSGNLVVFAASSGDESALPWDEKRHGMFTYNLLSKIKETEGDITYGELADFIRSNVVRRSILHNQRDQTPQINVSPTVDKNWEQWKLR